MRRAALAGFAVLLFGGFVVGSSADSSSSGTRTVYTAAFAGTGLSAIGFGIAGYVYSNNASDSAMEAYQHYDEGLQKRLSICVGARCGASVIHDTSGR